MSEQNIVNVMVIPDVPKVLPGEQLYVYVPKASFTFPGIIAYNNTQFRIDGNFLFIREDYVSPGVQQKIDELKQYTLNKYSEIKEFEVEYVEIADETTLQSVKNWNESEHARIFVALQLGQVRLIDNLRIY